MSHMEDITRWGLEEIALRLESHANACAANARATKDGLLAQMNRERFRVWSERAAEARAKLKAYDDERSK